jgi:hypothetical protein
MSCSPRRRLSEPTQQADKPPKPQGRKRGDPQAQAAIYRQTANKIIGDRAAWIDHQARKSPRLRYRNRQGVFMADGLTCSAS